MWSTQHDDGFTLNELLVVIVLMGIILAVAYGGYYVVAGSARISDRQAYITREISGPLDELERIVMQQTRILNDQPSLSPGPKPTQLPIYTDMDSDDHYETQVFVVKDDHTLLLTRSEEVDSPTPRTWVVSDHNYNIEAGIPLFRYYDASGAELTDMSQVSSRAYRVNMTIVTEYDGERFMDSRTVFFRN